MGSGSTPPSLEVDVLGARVAVWVPPELTHSARTAWSHCRPRRPGPPYDALVDLRDHERGERWVAHDLSQRLTALAIDHQAGERLMLHAACVVEQESESGLVLVGESGAGKTTAAIHLCRNGFAYVTDETVAVDAAHRALLYRKPLSVIADAPDRPKTQLPPAALGLAVAQEPPRVGRLILLSRAESATGPLLEPVPALDAVVELIAQTSSLSALPQPLSRLADLIATTGGAVRLRYSEIAAVADLVRDVSLTRAPLSDAQWTLHRPAPGAEADPGVDPRAGSSLPLGAGARLTRGPYTEALEQDRRVLVLAGDTPARLAGIGATIWLSCDRPRSLAHLTARCIAAHGSTHDADHRVAEAVGELLGAGLLAARGPASAERA